MDGAELITRWSCQVLTIKAVDKLIKISRAFYKEFIHIKCKLLDEIQII